MTRKVSAYARKMRRRATGQDTSAFIDGLKAPAAVQAIDGAPKTTWRFPAVEGEARAA